MILPSLATTLSPITRAATALCCCLFAGTAVVHAAPGDLDTGFTANANDETYSAALQPGGKLLVGGNFSVIRGQSRRFLTRLLPDGTVDTQFNATATAIVWGITTQPDGKALIAGFSHPSFPGPIMYRVLTNGTMDPGFTTPVPDSDVRSLSLRSDGVITAAGPFRNLSGVSRSYAARLTSTGSLDATVLPLPNSRLFCQAMLPDGKLLIGGGFSVVGSSQRYRIARLNANGSLDSGFNTSFFEDTPMIYCIAVQADGKILVGGTYASSTITNRYYLSRHLANGALDTAFTTVVNDDVTSIVLQCDGKIICSGDFTTVNGVARNRIARLHADGTLDTTFNPDANATVDGTSLQADGKVIVNGRFSRVGRGNRDRIARLLNDPATESLTVPSPARIQWLRGGSSPETHFVSFDVSTDGGSTWTPQGAGTRIAGGWERTGLALPRNGQIRARAVTICGINNGSQGILETILPFTLVPEIAVHDGTPEAGSELLDGQTNSVEWPAVKIGSTPEPERVFTIRNHGQENLQVTSISLPPAWIPVPPPQLPAVVSPGGVLSFTIRLRTDTAGTFTGRIAIGSNDPNEAVFDFPVSGTVLAPDIVLRALDTDGQPEILSGQAAAVDLGTTRQGEFLGIRIGVNNSGAASLIISGLSSSPPFKASLIPSWHPLPRTINTGESAVLSITVDTSIAGTFTGMVTLVSDDPDESTFQFSVTAAVLTPEIEVHDGDQSGPELSDDQAVAFHLGTARLGTPLVRTLTVVSSGTLPLSLRGLVAPPGFTFINPPVFPAHIPIGEALPLSLQLNATALGSFSGSVRISSDDFDEGFFDFPVTGTVITPEITVRDGTAAAPELADGQAAAVDFGRNIQGTPGTRNFTIANTGTAELMVSSVTVPPGFTAVNVPALPGLIGVGQSVTFQISLSTLTVGTHAGSVVIASDDLDEAAFDFPITGEIFIPDPVATAPVSSTALNRQTGLREQTLHITNNTTATVPAYNLIIRGLPAGVEVNNASERRPDGSWVVYIRRTMLPHSTQDILLEYFSATRAPVDIAPQLSTEVVLHPPDLTATGGGFAIDRVQLLAGGAVLIEFPTMPGRQYQVQYSHDGTAWQASLPAIRAAANRTQWLDRGLPRTDSHPAASASRFYRVAELAP